MNAKPQRIATDPEGFEAAFDGDDHPCDSCAFNGGVLADDFCPSAPCHFHDRPEKRGIHFVRIEVQSSWLEQTGPNSTQDAQVPLADADEFADKALAELTA